ncbi:MAG: DsbA family protein [Chitinophagaceae bacterium]
MDQKPVIIYCYDAYCGWCFGFSKVIKRLFEEYKEVFDFEVLSGGMIPKESAQPIGRMASYIKEGYKRVEELSGVKFGEDYLWHINNPDRSDWFPHSETPAIALAIFRDYHPHDTVLFATDLQDALHVEGRDLTDGEAYRHLLEKYDIPADAFYERLTSEEYLDRARHDFAMVKQLQVTGFPAVLLQADELKFYLLGRGYTDYETMKQRFDQVINELSLQVK